MLEFRELKDIDLEMLEKIKKIEDEAFDGDGGVDFWILKALVNYGKVFVLEKNGETVSLIEYIRDFDGKIAFVYGLCTVKKYQRLGYAKMILELGEEYLKEKGVEEIKLTVAPNNEKAMELYRKLGYVVEKFNKNEYGEGIDRNLMKKVII